MFLKLVSLVFIFNQSYSQTELLNGTNAPIEESTARDSSELYSRIHTDQFCSPPPLRSQCPTINTELENGRLCLIDGKTLETSRNSEIKTYQVFSTEDENIFEIDINVIFSTDSLNSVTREADYTAFIEEAQTCLRNRDPKLDDGLREIRLNLNPIRATKENFATAAPGTATVQLHNSYARPNSTNYPLNIDCATLMHEMLHLVGLHDEYHENSTRYTPNQSVFESELGINLPPEVYTQGLIDQRSYECRFTPSTNNMMMSQNRFQSLQSLEVQLCIRTSEQTSNSVSNIQTLRADNCPDGYKATDLGSAGSMQDLQNITDLVTRNNDPSRYGSLQIIYQTSGAGRQTGPSMRRAQISSILFPNCLSRPEVNGYVHSAENSYRNRYSTQRCQE